MKYFLIILIITVCGCSTISTYYPQKYYTVTKIKGKKNNVYFIYAKRNDSIFKIYTHYNGKKDPKAVKLKRGSIFSAHLESFNEKNIRYLNLVSWAEVSGFEYYNVIVLKEPQNGIYDIYECKNINGIFFSCDTTAYYNQ